MRDCAGWTPCRYGTTEQMRYGALVIDPDWPDRAHFSAAAGLGDVDGDGLEDVAFGGTSHSTNYEYDGAAYVFRGGRHDRHPLDHADAVLVGPARHMWAGYTAARAGDVDGDGLGDLLVAAGNTFQGSWLLSGPDILRGALLNDSATAVAPVQAALYSQSVTGAGDVDGDGFGEVLVGDYYVPELRPWQPGAVFLFRGPLSGGVSRGDASTTWWGDDGMELGRTVKHVGDVTGDGRPDVAFAARHDPEATMTGTGLVFLASNPPAGALSTADVDARLSAAAPAVGVGVDLAGGADVDADGYDDLIVTKVTSVNGTQDGAWLVLGPLSGEYDLDSEAEAVFTAVHGVDGTEHGLVWGEGDWNQPAKPGMLDSAGDFDGDGLGDLVVAGWGGTEEYPNPIGFVLLGGNPLRLACAVTAWAPSGQDAAAQGSERLDLFPDASLG